MIKKFFSTNYKKPLFWIIPAAVLVCAAAAVIAVTNPFEKAEGEPKKDMQSQEVTVEEDGASKDDVTVIKETNKEETPQLTEDSQPVGSQGTGIILHGPDKTGGLSAEEVKKIKTDYIKSDERYKNLHYTSVVINEYYGTLSDGSLLLDICIPRGYPDVVDDNIWFNVVDNYAYLLESINHPNHNLQLYKNFRFYDIKAAYEQNVITKKVVDEIFNKNPQLNICNDYLNPKDNAGGLSISEIIYMKHFYLETLFDSYRGEVSYRDKYGIPEVKDFYISEYYKTFGSGYKGYFIKQSKVSDNMSETVGIYKYKHIAGDNLLLIAENPNAMTNQSFEVAKYNCYNLKSAYENKIITDAELERFFKDFPEYLGE